MTPSRLRPWLRRALLVACLVAVGLIVGFLGWCQRGLAEARLLAKHGLWPDVHASLDRYQWLHPGSAEAHLLAAEALVKDDALPLERRIGGSLARLRRIPNSDPLAAEARVAEARVELFLNSSPTAAEKALRGALERFPDDVAANTLLWKLLDLTRRSEQAEPYFWKVYDGTPPDQQPLRLRDWYLSQFYPVTSTMELDRMMGFRISPQDDSSGVESNRLVRFRGSELGSPLCNAAMARWFQSEGELPFALELLDTAAAGLSEEEEADPFFMATLVDVLIELGEVDRAGEVFDRWTAPAAGRDYWLARGRVMQESKNDPAEAARSFQEALVDWPGPIDWRSMNRAANCLARAGDQEGAKAMRERAAGLELFMDEKLHRRLRAAMGQIDNPEVLQEVVDFYQRIDRPREAWGWSEYIRRLRE